MKEIIVICPNRPGMIAAIGRLLAERNINIDSFEAEGAIDKGTVILSVSAYDEALRALRDAGYQAYSEDALVVRLEDKPGGLAAIGLKLEQAQVNIRSLRLIARADEFALAAIVTDDQDKAREVLGDAVMSAGS